MSGLPTYLCRDYAAVMDGYDAFGLTASELAALPPRGAGADAFAALQRPWRWGSSGPLLAPRAQRALGDAQCTLPAYEKVAAADGSTKLLFTFEGDRVEAVHMPRGDRVTLCISSQVGCAIGCRFCATATMGFRRHLSAAEIVAQVLTTMHVCGPRHPSQLTLVFMGMGEPLHNLDNVLRSIEILCDVRGLGIAPKRITVSTSGLVPQIDALGRAPVRPLLALSLNATTDATRRELMPIGQRYSLGDLASALARYPMRPGERVLLEYVLLDGINDTPLDAQRLAEFGANFPHHINLIPFNAHPHSPYRAPTPERVAAFAKAVLSHRPTFVTVRKSRARDVQGACGQLVILRTGQLPLARRSTRIEPSL